MSSMLERKGLGGVVVCMLLACLVGVRVRFVCCAGRCGVWHLGQPLV